MKNVMTVVTGLMPFIPDIIEYFQDDKTELSKEQLDELVKCVNEVDEQGYGIQQPEWMVIAAYMNSLYDRRITASNYMTLYNQQIEK